MKNWLKHSKLFIVLIAFACSATCGAGDLLATVFRSPPEGAKPAIGWFLGEFITTDHGITQALEALKRVGFGGVVFYEQVFTDRPGALKSLSSEWLRVSASRSKVGA
jgi:hypothetical protein